MPTNGYLIYIAKRTGVIKDVNHVVEVIENDWRFRRNWTAFKKRISRLNNLYKENKKLYDELTQANVNYK